MCLLYQKMACFFAGMRLLSKHPGVDTYYLGIMTCMVSYHQVDTSLLMESISYTLFSSDLKHLIIGSYIG